jgi:hypothetical protein
MCISDYRWGLDWWIDLLSTYKSWLQITITLLLISTLSLHSLLSLVITWQQLSALAVPLQRLHQTFPDTNLSSGDSSAAVASWLTLHSWTLNCTALTRWTDMVGWVIQPRVDLQRTPPASHLLLLCDITVHGICCGRYVTMLHASCIMTPPVLFRAGMS